MVNKMPEIIKNFQLSKIESNNYKRILNEIKKIKGIKSATINKEKNTLRIEVSVDRNERKAQARLEKVKTQITNAILAYEKKATIEEIIAKEVYRRVLYLNGLDCAHCATKIETIAKRELDYEKLLVDYTSFRFIIESSNKEQMNNIIDLVTKIAHKVDERIEVTEKVKKVEELKEEEKPKKYFRDLTIIFGAISYIFSYLCLIEFRPANWHRIFEHEEAFNTGSPYLTAHMILLIITYLLIGYPIIIRFLKNLRHGRFFDENSLMTIASIGAIATNHFSEAVMVLALFQLGEYLQHRAVNKCRKSIEELLKIDIKNAKIKKEDEVIEIEVESVLPDDIIVVNKGEMIPLDGILLNHKAMLDTKNLTGESLVREIDKGEVIMAGTVNMGDVIEIKVIRPYSESMITKILDMVENASASKAKAENFITKFSRYYTPIILVLAIIIGVCGYFIETNYIMPSVSVNYLEKIQEWVYRSMVFLVISCPCALVISIPLCFFMGIGIASKRGILVKGSNYLETLNKVENIVFDKTGTLTKGEFKIQKIVPASSDIKEDTILKNLIYVEFYSNHPIGMSIVDDYGRENVFSEIISDFTTLSGGAKALVNGTKYTVGNLKLMNALKYEVPTVEETGLIIYVVKEKSYLGYVVIGDSIREEAKGAIQELHNQGVKNTYILTGDMRGIAEETASQIGVDKVYSELLPDEKVKKLEEIRESATIGCTVFIGDGINDAPAIAASDVGIAMGKVGSDATIAVSDVVIMSDDLSKLPDLLKIAKVTRRKVIQNIVISLSIKVLVMISAINPAFPLPLWLAIFSDVGVSLIAIFNSIFILGTFKNKKTNKKEEKTNEE
mgnify:FL=1